MSSPRVWRSTGPHKKRISTWKTFSVNVEVSRDLGTLKFQPVFSTRMEVYLQIVC